MRLYEVITILKTFEGDSNGVLPVGTQLFSPTEETFSSTRAFAAKVKTDGKQYQGKSWVVLPEGKSPPQTMTVKRVDQFEINMEG